MHRLGTKAAAANTPGLVKLRNFGWLTVLLAPLVFLGMGAVAPAHAQTYTFHTLYNFTGTNGDGSGPVDMGGLIMDSSGNLYGTTFGGGISNSNCDNGNGGGCGTVFKLDTHGNETVLHSFNLSDGSTPVGGVIIDSSNTLYGTTFFGGVDCINSIGGCGTVFKVNTSGSNFATLYSFTAKGDGEAPFAGLTIGAPLSILYGTTLANVFMFDLSSNTESNVYTPTGPPNDGSNVQGNVVIDSAGNLYGTTRLGGSSTNCGGDVPGCGTVFKVDTSGNETVLHNFMVSDGSRPYEGLALDSAGYLYGTTAEGGSSTNCVDGCGVVFKLDTSGNNFAVLHNFTSTNGDGATPFASLILDSQGNLYGTTSAGGSSASCDGGCGTVFELASNGSHYAVLHSFISSDGSFPIGPLLRDASGNLYGTAGQSGTYGGGTVFELSPTFPFSAFNGKLQIASGNSPGFQLYATLTQGAGAPAINPVQQGMTLTVGTYTVTIPPGSFMLHGKGTYQYEGTINGAMFQVRISQTGTHSYLVQVDASGVNLSPFTNPVAVTLTLGQNSGTTHVKG